MTTSKQIGRILAVVTAIGALLLLAGAASASSKPAGMTKAEYRALMLRSHALNKKYHLGSWAVSPASTTASTGGGFAWSAFGIGAAAMLGVVLLASGTIVGSRQGRRAPRPRISS
jgi:hypothetical protein